MFDKWFNEIFFPKVRWIMNFIQSSLFLDNAPVMCAESSTMILLNNGKIV